MDNDLLKLYAEDLKHLKQGIETSCKASPDWLLRTSNGKFMLNIFSGFCVEVNPEAEKGVYSGYTSALYTMEWKRARLNEGKLEELWKDALMHATCREADDKGMRYETALEAYQLLEE